MIKSIWLLIEPRPAWEKIAVVRHGVLRLFLTLLVPLLVVTSAVEGYGLARWGKPQDDGLYRRQYSAAEVVAYQIIQVTLTVAIILAAAALVDAVARSFHSRHHFLQSFTVVAYGLSPLMLMQMLNAFPAINPWVSWAIGIALVTRTLYQGIPCVMQPDAPNAFGLYLTALLLLTMATGMARFFTAEFLEGSFRGLEKPLVDLITRVIS